MTGSVRTGGNGTRRRDGRLRAGLPLCCFKNTGNCSSASEQKACNAVLRPARRAPFSPRADALRNAPGTQRGQASRGRGSERRRAGAGPVSAARPDIHTPTCVT